MDYKIDDSSIFEARGRAIAAACQIDGWLSEAEAGALFDYARLAPGPIVEIGSYQGRSTAALALGSMAGGVHPVYAVDSFIGPRPGDRPTAQGRPPSDFLCSAEILRANLDRAGVNGVVEIIPKRSAEAVRQLPDCALLFIDGGHSFTDVSADLAAYLPRIRPGGTVILHDCTPENPGVVRAVDEQIMGRPLEWLMRGRVDSAIIAVAHRAVPAKVFIAAPGSTFSFGVLSGLQQGSLGAHATTVHNSGNGWDDFDGLWADAMNAAERGEATHFAMLHSDVNPAPGWVDLLLAELQQREADLVSAVVPIKDRRGVTSCGIGDFGNPWSPFRRFTMGEIMSLPETFGLAETPYAGDPEKYLLHNTGCWACDLRRPIFSAVDETGALRCNFGFPRRIARNENGLWVKLRESEDWYFSRQIALLGARSFLTRKPKLVHRGVVDFPNSEPWGTYRNGDEDHASKWRPARG